MDAPSRSLLRAVAAQVRTRRRHRGLTLAVLSEESGVSTRFLAEIESGRANPSIVNLARIARALGTDPGTLLAEPGLPHVALLGLRGAGKSAVGAALARRLGSVCVELDQLVEEEAGLPLREIFAVHGESYYRRVEAQALDRFLARAGTAAPRRAAAAALRDAGGAAGPAAAVLATGGGIVTSPETYERLRRACFTVWLRARPEDHMRRVERQGDLRPMARRPDAMAELRQILAARAPLYAQADLTIDTERLDVEQVAERIEKELARVPAEATARPPASRRP